MIKSVQDAAYLRLIEAMYRRAKIDYYEALALYDIGKRRELEKFFLHDPYIYTKEQGEDIIETQSFDLEKDNVYVMAYVTPGRAKYLNRGYKATVIVNDDISYSATVVSMGARTEEIPSDYRNNLSKDHIAAIAVLRIDANQMIPFWSLVNGMPVVIRFNNLENEDVVRDQYLQLKTPKGLRIPDGWK